MTSPTSSKLMSAVASPVTAGPGNDRSVNVGGPRSSTDHVNTIIQGGLSVDLGEGDDSLRVGGSLIGR